MPMLTLVCGLVLVAGLALASGAGAVPASQGLREAKRFHAYRLYYPGPAVSGVRLSEVENDDWYHHGGRKIRWSFYYGHCAAGDDSGCSVPVQVHDYSTCRRWADAYPGKPHLFDFRGAKAAWVPTAGSLEVYTGRTTVVIYANHRSLAKAAAHQLRNVRRAHRPSRLPRPVPGSLWGRLPCQRKPG
jgi:hypothetical protein